MTSPIPARGNRSAITIPTITNETQARLIAHFLWTSTAYRSAFRSASRTRSAADVASDQLDSLTRGRDGGWSAGFKGTGAAFTVGLAGDAACCGFGRARGAGCCALD